MVDHLILVTCFILFPQQLDLLLHSLGLLEYALNTADISFEVLVHVEFLVKLESFEGFLEFSGFCVERDSIRVQDKDVGRILHPSLVNTDLRAAPTRLIVGYFILRLNYDLCVSYDQCLYEACYRTECDTSQLFYSSDNSTNNREISCTAWTDYPACEGIFKVDLGELASPLENALIKSET